MADVKISLRPNGPMQVEGPITLVDSAGNPVALDPAKSSIFLCRCGQSKNKPFCDGNHKQCGWTEVG